MKLPKSKYAIAVLILVVVGVAAVTNYFYISYLSACSRNSEFLKKLIRERTTQCVCSDNEVPTD